MTVHDSGVTGTNDVFVVQDGQLSFESGHSMYGFLWAGQYESWADIFVIDTAYTDPDVIAAERLLDLVFHLVVESGDFDFVLVGHEKESVTLAHESGLDLADDDGTHIFVFLRDGHHEGCVDFAIYHGHLVEVFEE